ncbi:MAG: isoleucine--tRNA ligase [Acidimicrobiales bacterium]|nr:isoleucine--tRNA ligase [Acidimicrobiales bacterium]
MPANSPARYPVVTSKVDIPALEERILERWKRNGTFESTVEKPAGSEPTHTFVFNDGPPFANGLPHYGHLLTGYVKDIIPRYHTMNGARVERRFGWDCHGLPAEMQTEKETGISGRKAILDFGIENFNNACRSSVLRYTSEWEDYVTRQARWVDFSNDYKTMDLDYMESVMWAFKQLWDKGLIYQADRVMPYSWGAQTPLSNFEIRLDDATRPRQDPAVTVAFSLDLRNDDPGELRVLAWTTTPWTLPSNLALAVGPDLTYVIVDHEGSFYVLAEGSLEKYQRELGEDPVVIGRLTGADLVGRSYRPLFPYFADNPNSFVVLGADFVELGEGTGVVHIAPGFGEDDQKISNEAGIPLVVPVDDAGAFTSEIDDFAGLNVFDANPKVIAALKDQGRVFRHETYDHNYPHCWRTDTPVIYRAVPSWYVRVSDLNDRLLAANQEINWIPEHVRDGQFGRWLEGARDWSISRNRFWGAPIPVWISDDPAHPRLDVYGSLDEIEADFGVRPTDLHRPFIDELVRPNPDDPSGTAMMRRVPEVLDCWFESGSMPYAQLHYPFENVERFEESNPADFIVEYVAQTRGWFYTMHVLSVALFDRPAFKNVICHGVVLDSEGQKLSKKLRNYPDPTDIFNNVGADPMRWYLVSSPILRGLDTRIEADDSGVREVVRQVMNPLWNAYSFFTLYANASSYEASHRTSSDHVLDRYILAKTSELITKVTEQLDAYDLAGACAAITTYLDALTNWYIRRSRERFWNTQADATLDTDALDTLYTVLLTVMKVAAPLLPMLTEEIYTGLTDEDRSVHQQPWPNALDLRPDPDLVAGMDAVRAAASAALSLREDLGIRVRQPLRSVTVAGEREASMTAFTDLLADEINVKEVRFSGDVHKFVDFRMVPNARILGPRLGRDVQAVIKAAKAGDWEDNDDGTVTAAGIRLSEEEFERSLVPAEGVVAAALPGNDAIVVLDIDLTDDLRAEGTARDVVRAVQNHRKEAGLEVTDRILLSVDADDATLAAIRSNLSWVEEQVLATESRIGDDPRSRDYHALAAIEGGEVTIGFSRAAAGS